MILTDYFRSERDTTWDFAIQSGVKHGVIRLPEDGNFDYTDASHWSSLVRRFTDFGITPVAIDPMPNELRQKVVGKREKRLSIVFSKRVTKITSHRSECIERRGATIFSEGENPTPATKKKSRVSGFFFLYFSLFSFHSSLFSKSPTRLFQRRDKREERKEKVAFLPLVEKH